MKRKENESWDDYVLRRWDANQELKEKLRGKVVWWGSMGQARNVEKRGKK